MTPMLPEILQGPLDPVFHALPPERAMGRLVVDTDPDPELVKLVERAEADEAVQPHPALRAGLWLYIDALDASHTVSQGINTPTGSFWHAIMHRREGDFSNARHWLGKVGRHPVFSRIDVGGGGAGAGTSIGNYDPAAFVDRVQRAQGDAEHPELVSVQRHEWRALFEWCAEQPTPAPAPGS